MALGAVLDPLHDVVFCYPVREGWLAKESSPKKYEATRNGVR